MLFYGCSALVFFLFFTINMTPWTNFVVPDLWHWLEVHMWVAVTFEIFTVCFCCWSSTCTGRRALFDLRDASRNGCRRLGRSSG